MITIAVRRASLARRAMLDRPAADLSGIADRLVGLHATDPATVVLSMRARQPTASVAEIDGVLWHAELLRMHAMRRTMFVVGRQLARIMNSSCTVDLVTPERRRLVAMIEGQGLAANGEMWIDELAAAIDEALASLDVASARQLTAAVPGLARQLAFGAGKKWEGTVGMSTRMLYLLAIEGKIARARPSGSWTSGQYRWCRLDRVVPGGLEPIDPTGARTELVRRYLATYGPATTTDVKWWTGWPLNRVRPALTAAGAVEVDVEAALGAVTTAWVLPDDAEGHESAAADDDGTPWVALLPALDSTVMGWKERAWYLGGHGAQVFDRNGNAGPTIWVDGRIVGGWACADGGQVRLRVLDDIGRERIADIEVEAQRLTDWLDGVRVTPRFRSPLDLELVPRSTR